MTKVGKKGAPKPKPLSPEEQLKKSVGNFKHYLNEYDQAVTSQDKTLVKDKMSSELSLMDVVSEGAKKKETRVCEQKLSKDFKLFQQQPNERNEDVIKQDVTTLGESLEH